MDLYEDKQIGWLRAFLKALAMVKGDNQYVVASTSGQCGGGAKYLLLMTQWPSPVSCNRLGKQSRGFLSECACTKWPKCVLE